MLNWLKKMASGWVNKDPGDDYWYSPRGMSTAAGIDVNEGKAMGLPTVFACVSKIAKTVASLPIQVYDKPNPDTRKPVDHPLNELFGGTAYEYGSGMTVSETRMANMLLWGTGYNRIIWNGTQTEPLALIPLESANVEPTLNASGELVFKYQEEGWGQPEVIHNTDMFWVPGMSIGGMIGLSVIRYHRDTVGTHFAKRQFGGSFFKNGARVGGLIKRSMEADRMRPLSKEGASALLESFNAIHQGSENAFKWGMLREDMEAVQLPSMPLEDAQYVEGMQFDREDICGIFDTPPSKIQDHTHSTFSNIEHLGIDWATDTILPWCVRVEQAVKRTFLRDSTLYFKHNLAGIARGDVNSRYTAYATGRNWGWLSINDVRRLEDLNPIPDGDDYLQPLNMQVVGEPEMITPPSGPPNQPQDDNQDDNQDDPTTAAIRASVELPTPSREEVANDMRPMIEATCRTILAAEFKAVGIAIERSKKKGFDNFDSWLASFCVKHAKAIEDAMWPLVATFEKISGSVVQLRPNAIGEAWAAQVQAGVLAAVDADDMDPTARLLALTGQTAWVTRILIGE